MKRILLFCWLLFAAVVLQGQGIDHAHLQERLDKACDLVFDGKHAEAAAMCRQIASLCRQQGDAFLCEEMDALQALSGLEESLAGKKAILQEMKDRVASVRNPQRPELVRAYVALAESAIDKQEGHGDASVERLLAIVNELFEVEAESVDGRLVLTALIMRIAEILEETGIFESSREFYQGAEALLGEPASRKETMMLADIYTGQALPYIELRQYDDALSFIDRAERLYIKAQALNSRRYAYLWLNCAAIASGRGDVKNAEDLARKALDRVPEPCVDRAEMLLLYTSYAIMLGDMQLAEPRIQEMESLMSKFEMRPNWRISYYQLLAVMHATQGRAKKAIEATEQALAIFENEHIVNPKLVSSLYKQQALNYSMLGDIDNSEYYNKLGDYVLEVNYGKEFADKSAERKLDSQDSVHGRTSALMDEVGRDFRAGKTDSALEKIDQVLELYKEAGVSGLMYLMTENMKIHLLENVGDTDGLKRAVNTYLADLRSDVRLNLSYMTEAEREAYYAGVMPSISYAYLAEKDASLATPVYNSVLLRKNFILGAGLSLDKLIADSGDPSLQEVLAEIKTLRSGPAADSNIPEEERDAARSRANSLENILIRKSHDYGDFLALADICWEDVRDALAPDEVAVEYIQCGTENLPVYCMLVLRNKWLQPKSVLLGVDDEHVIEELADPEYAEAVYSAPELYNVFWQPLEEYLKPGDKVYFAMDGFLNAFAFEHFQSEEGDYAMDRFELHRVSSTRELIGRKKAAPERSAALFGGFDYNLSSEEVSYYASATRSGSSEEDWGYLPGSLDEVETADSILEGKLDVTLYTGEEGLESRFKALSGQAPDLLHVATHGYYVEGNDDPMDRSGLVFSGANALREEGPAESGEDGLLKSSEIALLDLRGTDLIVLSACQSGIGSISSDGVYGLQRAFKKAGVHSILMSLWKVNDQVTAEMMRLFYTGLAAGKDSRSAFQAARETLRKTYPDPLLWAPFVLLES